jgi:hypothetical protein
MKNLDLIGRGMPELIKVNLYYFLLFYTVLFFGLMIVCIVWVYRE